MRNQGDRLTKIEIRTAVVSAIVAILSFPVGAGERDLLSNLETRDIESARINLNAWGASLGFESEFEGDDPRLERLIAMISSANQGGGHKCPNMSAIRLRMAGGGVIGLGLLPSHSKGLYGFRLYDGGVFLGAYVVQRSPFLSALKELGVPMDDPAFQE